MGLVEYMADKPHIIVGGEYILDKGTPLEQTVTVINAYKLFVVVENDLGNSWDVMCNRLTFK